ncbi:MAG: flavin reductase family protein [Acidimicrobiia bacterium]
MGTAEGLHALTGLLDYPMFVVTVAAGGERSGCLVGFVTQCSIHPPRFLVCLSDKNHTTRVAGRARVLAIHVLGREQRPLAELFGAASGDDVDKFTRCPWEPGPDGTPLLRGCPGRLVGHVVARHDLGDHIGFVVEVTDADVGPPLPLLTFQEVRHLEPGHRA